MALYEPDAVLCHRDAEGAQLTDRSQEIDLAAGQLAIPTIPVVPVRMVEAWLMFNEDAIRAAADNRNGTMPLQLPGPALAERLADPKASLFAALNSACGLSARRRKSFNEHRARSRVTSFIEDFAPLRQLTAFQRFEQRFVDTITAL